MTEWRKLVGIWRTPRAGKDDHPGLEDVFSFLLDNAFERATQLPATACERRNFKFKEHEVLEFDRHKSFETEDGTIVSWYDDSVYYKVSAEYKEKETP